MAILFCISCEIILNLLSSLGKFTSIKIWLIDIIQSVHDSLNINIYMTVEIKQFDTKLIMAFSVKVLHIAKHSQKQRKHQDDAAYLPRIQGKIGL